MRVLGSDMRLEKLAEIPVFQVFHHHAVRFFAIAGAEDPGDIAILQSSQDPHVSLEVQSVHQKRFLVNCNDRSEVPREFPTKWRKPDHVSRCAASSDERIFQIRVQKRIKRKREKEKSTHIHEDE
jgi:hypothetical protein